MQNLNEAVADLKIGRSRDPEGLINEIFKNNVIGVNLKKRKEFRVILAVEYFS